MRFLHLHLTGSAEPVSQAEVFTRDEKAQKRTLQTVPENLTLKWTEMTGKQRGLSD
jgi:hypothetical protein